MNKLSTNPKKIEFMIIGHSLKGQGQVTVNKTDISIIYIVAHTWLLCNVFCTDFGGWGESTTKLLLKIHQHLRIRTTYERFACFLTKFKIPSSK